MAFSLPLFIGLILVWGFAPIDTVRAKEAHKPFNFTTLLEYQEEPENPPPDHEAVISQLNNFRPLPNSDGHLGFSKKPIWLRLQLPAELQGSESRVLVFSYAPLDYIDAFLKVGENSAYERWQIGDRYPFGQRSYPYRLANIALPQATGDMTLYFRIQTESSVQVGGKIYAERDFFELLSLDLMGLGLYYGGLFILVVYNLFIYFSLRESIYLTYVLYVASFFVFQSALNGTLYQYALQGFHLFGNQILPLSSFLFAFFLARFTTKYLGLNGTEIFDRLFRGFTWLQLVFALLALLIPYSWSIQLTTLIGVIFPLLGLLACVRQLKRKVEGAFDFSVAFFFFLFFCGLYGLKTAGLIPIFFLTEYSLQIGSLGEATLLSIALAHRIDRLKRSVILLNQELQAEVNEKSRVFHELEEKMQEHTDLQERTAIMTFHLEGLKHELASATQRLIQADKLATLGVMSAGVAHDIASPSNVIVLNQGLIRKALEELRKNLWELLQDEDDPDVLTIRNDFAAQLSSLEEALGNTDLAIKRIGDISRAVRNVARADLEASNFSLAELIRETLLIIRSRIAEIQLEYPLDKDIDIRAQRSQIGQIFMNLFVNAADAINSAGNVQRRILVEWTVGPEHVEIAVHDTGTGLSPEVQKKIGEAFFTTKPKDKGTGLGMSIIKRILDQHESRLEVGNSSILCGAKMTIYLKRLS